MDLENYWNKKEIRCYSIKIVITGGLQSGKSSYVKFLDENAMKIEAQGQD